MATTSELWEALTDYTSRAKDSARVQRTLKNWDCIMHIAATDIESNFTCVIRGGEFVSLDEGLNGVPDLVIRGDSEDLANVFWGDENPASNYMQGAIEVRGSQEDIIRLDAMAMFLYLDLGGQ
ncbi:SCP2 sterol-binding domain-containing protein [Alicyclobacillus curvatus]|nr:SCP2 sterol-binding domain-containing protein [Alicyclobacillus curvatus]